MKKLIGLLAVGLMLCAFSTAHAQLLGVGLAGFPDIEIDSTSTISYNYIAGAPNVLTITADDTIIKWGPNPLTDWDVLPAAGVDFSLTITVDDAGKLIPDAGLDMFEHVDPIYAPNGVVIRGETYLACTDILNGNVYAFGWEFDNTSPYDNSRFDFLLNNLGGGLVNDGLWPATMPTGIVIGLAGHMGTTGAPFDWTHDWTMSGAKMDKGPVPEPGTLMLVGGGLLGLAGIRRKLRK